MSDNAIEKNKSNPIEQYTGFEHFLNDLGLPNENIIASPEERKNIMEMLPGMMKLMPISQKEDATYLSRFVASAAVGLFDASLNYVWNEVVISLRKKICFYGIDTFFDNAVGSKIRDQYENEEDLVGIKDRTMLETLKKLEWISNIVYLKLKHILDMRNQIGASHPNSYDINSYELLGWLKTCVSEVINDQPSSSAIHTKEILESIKKSTASLDDITVDSIGNAIEKYSSSISNTFLRSLFSIFVGDNTSMIARSNILKLSKRIWDYCTDDIKYDLGEKKLLYRNNLQKDKEDLSYKFLENCNGLSYLSFTERSLEISALCDDLLNAHNGWDNYYHEPPIAKEIMKYITTASDIPEEIESKLISVFLECRIGREVDYCDGVSQGAIKYYDSLLKMLTEEQIKYVLSDLNRHMISINRGDSVQAKNIREVINLLSREDLSERVNEIVKYIIEFDNRGIIHKVYQDKGFKDISKGIIQLN